jgi:phosphate:Na+ symporter
VEWLIPDRPVTPQRVMLPKYLDDDLVSSPAVALEAVRSETRRLGKKVRKMVKDVMPTAITGTRDELEQLAERDKVIDALHSAIIEYLGKISLGNLTKRQSAELLEAANIANGLEQIGDRIATGMVTSAGKRIDEEVHVSPRTADYLNEYHAIVVETLDEALKAVARQDPDLAKHARGRKKDFSEMSRELAAHGLDRLTADEPNRLKTYAREMEIMEILEVIFSIARRIANTAK